MRTKQHVTDVWKVIETGRSKHGENWYGSGGYHKADAFTKHFANHCRECKTSHEVRAKMKKIMRPRILWQGDRIQCMKSAKTASCKICMVERKEILHRFRNEKSKIMNDNSDIYASCTCGTRFHKFGRYLTNRTLRTRRTQKKVTSTRNSKQKRAFTFDLDTPRQGQQISDDTSEGTPEPVSPPATPVFL